MKFTVTQRTLMLGFATFVLASQSFSQSLFAKAKEDSGKSLAVYKSVLRDYFSRWAKMLEAAPETDAQGQPAIHVNPAERRLSFSMKISVNESVYSEWRTAAFAKLAEAGIPEAEAGGLSIGGKQWAFPNQQGIDKWFEDKDFSMPEMTFRAMLVDSEGGAIRSAEFHMARKSKIVTTEYEAMLRSWTEVKTNSVETLPLTWAGRLKDCEDWETTDWRDKDEDGDACHIWVEFKKLTDDEMEHTVGVKCVVLDEHDIMDEQIAAARAKWNGREEDAKKEILQILADMIKVPGMDCAIGRYEVRQSQWEAVMESNSASTKNRGSDRPAVRVRRKDALEFLARLNAYPNIHDSGIRFRLPDKSEWKTACLAGSSGEIGLITGGQEGTIEKLGWFDNRNGARLTEDGISTHDVGTKQPNAWGFCDMLGNVWERIGDAEEAMGGSYASPSWQCTANSSFNPGRTNLGGYSTKDWNEGFDEENSSRVGIRLCVDWSETMQSAIDDAEEELEKLDTPIDRHAAIQSIVDGMIAVPGTDVKIGKFEVTQLQWEAVMVGNPSKFKGENRPVESVTKNDVEKFLELLNATEEVSSTGLRFRLPTKQEWQKAALAGGLTEDAIKQQVRDGKLSSEEISALQYGKIENREFRRGFGYGLLEDGSEAQPNDVAWHGGDDTHDVKSSIDSTAKGMTHNVGLKKPNAWGFFDMCGNVAEVVKDNSLFVGAGGSWNIQPQSCSACSGMGLHWIYGSWDSGDAASEEVGIRLCATDPKLEKERAEERAEKERKGKEAAQKRAITELIASLCHVPKTKFAIGIHNVTHGQWNALAKTNSSNDSRSPVVNVSLEDCEAFIKAINAEFSTQCLVFRLPTAKEWEKADENLPTMIREVRDWTSTTRGYNYLTMPDGPPGHDSSYRFHNISLRLCADWTPALENVIAMAKEELEVLNQQEEVSSQHNANMRKEFLVVRDLVATLKNLRADVRQKIDSPLIKAQKFRDAYNALVTLKERFPLLPDEGKTDEEKSVFHEAKELIDAQAQRREN